MNLGCPPDCSTVILCLLRLFFFSCPFLVLLFSSKIEAKHLFRHEHIYTRIDPHLRFCLFVCVFVCLLVCSVYIVAQEIFSRMVNKQYIKMCGDGTFRMMREQWIALTLGILSKRYGASRGDKIAAFRTTFSACFFAVTNTESEASYKFLFKCARDVVQRLCGIDLTVAVRQYHGDWHAGEENARREVFPNSMRCGDWAHFVGACTVRTRTPVLPQSQAGRDGQEIKAWRSGVYHTIRGCFDALSEKDDAVEFFKPIFELTRCVPTLSLFHKIWHQAFSDFGSRNAAAEACVRKLVRLYLIKLQAAHAKKWEWSPGMAMTNGFITPLGGAVVSVCSRVQHRALKPKKHGTKTLLKPS